MRGSIPFALVATAWLAASPAQAQQADAHHPHAQHSEAQHSGARHDGDLDGLRRDWHRCIRQSFSGQPATLEKRAAERAALAACRPGEDAYVAAELASRAARAESASRGDGLTTRARAWISSVAAYVVDPVASWLGR